MLQFMFYPDGVVLVVAAALSSDNQGKMGREGQRWGGEEKEKEEEKEQQT